MKRMLAALALIVAVSGWTEARAGESMSQAEVYAAIAHRTGLKKEQVKAVLDELAMLACEEAKRGFTIPGIGKLSVVERASRKGRDAGTGDAIDIPVKKALKFQISKSCTEAALGGGAQQAAGRDSQVGRYVLDYAR
jgi:DNA-binding protein HU-beta